MRKKALGMSAGTLICEEDGFISELIPSFTIAQDLPYPDTESIVGFHQAVGRLSPDASYIVRIVTEHPPKLSKYLSYGGQERDLSKRSLFRYLKYREGWEPSRVRKAFKEIKTMLTEL